MSRTREPDPRKLHGAHSTPPKLARFLADVTVQALPPGKGPLLVLDPACGEGNLLRAFAQAVPRQTRQRLILEGYETDSAALASARTALQDLGVREVRLQERDFLSASATERNLPHCDVVIANPPYVRTQVLGSSRSRKLAAQFNLSGRVDLYDAFIQAMTRALKPGGVLGLLTSNRFLTIQSGAAVRKLLRSCFDLRAIYDLGDTKLFSAAVLPAIVVAVRQPTSPSSVCTFDRIYETRTDGDQAAPNQPSPVLKALRDRQIEGTIHAETGIYRIERGQLRNDPDEPVWALTTPALESWLRRVHQARACSFGNVARVRVGIKTTADEVFIRDDWDALPAALRPEPELLRPLLTHQEAGRWRPVRSERPRKVLYPHTVCEGKRIPIRLEEYPRAAAYLETHRARLTRRRYVAAAGRSWYEVWVPHQPADWAKPKIVFPDIAEQPRFFLDRSGALVNGDCYWITLKEGVPEEDLLLMLAVANSAFITQYYDARFHNKLYSGRRRFMTQYVKEFPLPDVTSTTGKEIVRMAAALVEGVRPDSALEGTLDLLVHETFGVAAK